MSPYFLATVDNYRVALDVLIILLTGEPHERLLVLWTLAYGLTQVM